MNVKVASREKCELIQQRVLLCVRVCSESRLSSFWSLITDTERQVLANDKLLSQASHDGIDVTYSCVYSSVCSNF